MKHSALIETDTCLMPQHVPGARAGAGYRQIEMVPANGTLGLVFTVDQQSRLRLWLNSEAGATRWVCVDALFDGDAQTVLDFSIEQNLTQGRLDGTLDLMLITEFAEGAGVPQRRWYVWNGLPASADAQAWRDLFQRAVPEDTHGLQPESAHWGQAPRAHRSRLLRGRDAQGRWRLLWQRFDGHGVPLHDALEPPFGGSAAPVQLEVACTVDQEDTGLRREGYARHLVFDDPASGRAGYLDLVWPAQDGQARHEARLTALNGSPKGWETGEDLWPLTLAGSGATTRIYFDSTRDAQGVIEASLASPGVSPLVSTLAGAAVPGRVRALRWAGDDDRILRFDLVRASADASPSLRLTASHDFSGAQGARSTLLSDSVAAFAACLCSQPHSALQVLHVALVHEQGGIELLSQDSVSGLWQRATLADDDVGGAIHEVTTHTTTLRVLDASRAPLPDTSILIRADVPCHAYVGGRSLHLSPLMATELRTDGFGQCRIAQISNGLSASQLRFEVVDAAHARRELAVNPMQPLSERLRAIRTGADLQQVPGFDGSRPFAGVPLARCDSTCALLQQLVAAYDQTLAPGAASRPGDPGAGFDALGDMLGYLWSEGIDPLDYAIERLADGGYQIALQIGDRLWRGLIVLPQHAMALIDHAVQRGLGVGLRDIVNWLGQLFNWDEILATQATLRQLVTLLQRQARDWLASSAAPAIAQQMAWARDTFARMPDLDPKTRAWLERDMASGPGPQPYAADAGGPASGWALASVQDHAAAARIANAGQWAFAGGVEALMTSLVTDLEPVVQRLGEALAGLDPQTQPMLGLFEDLLAISSTTLIDVFGEGCMKLAGLLAEAVDAVWVALDQRLEIPVLTPLYEQRLVPGGKPSALDLMLLASAIAGDVGSRALHRRPLFSPELARAIAQARSLNELLAAPAGAGTAPNWSTDLQLAVTVVSGAFNLIGTVFFLEERSIPLAEYQASIVRMKCCSDAIAWVIAQTWTIARCATAQPPSEALKAAVAMVTIDGLVSRLRGVGELYYGRDEQPVSAGWLSFSSKIEGMFCVVLPFIAIYGVIEAALMPHDQPSDDTNWNFLVAMPFLQSLGSVADHALEFAEFHFPAPPLTKARNVIAGVRSALPLVSAIALGVAAGRDWKVPGTMAI